MKAPFFFLFFPLQIFAQDLTGVWTGRMESAGSTLPYEVVISQQKEKLTGYALTIFSFNGVENMGIKSINLKNKKGSITLEDHELVYDNYATPPKKVKLIGTLVLDEKGKKMTLSGTFFTRSLDFRSQDKQAYTGTIFLQKRDDNTPTRLLAKLDELNLSQNLSFVTPRNKPLEEPAVAAAVTDDIPAPAVKEIQRSVAVAPKEAKTALPPQMAAGNRPAVVKLPEAVLEPDPDGPGAEKETSVAVAYKRPWIRGLVPTKVALQRRTVPDLPPPVVAVIASPEPKTAVPATKTAPPVTTSPQPVTVAAAALAKRKTEIIQQVSFRSDSLVLTLYDNGTIDGDTVSVVLNGQVLLARKGLTANAIRTVVHITPEMGDSLQLVMYAENLGSIPPNTGLLIVQDGDQRNEIRFAGDYQKSSAIVLRRKR